MRHQLGTEVTDGEEVVRSLNYVSVFFIEHRQPVETEKMAVYSEDHVRAVGAWDVQLSRFAFIKSTEVIEPRQETRTNNHFLPFSPSLSTST